MFCSQRGNTMRRSAIPLGAALLAFSHSAAMASCIPLHSEVVSLGEKAARFYSDRSLQGGIEAERQRLASMALAPGRVTKTMNCAPYPNLLGADEWRCTGEAKVCTK